MGPPFLRGGEMEGEIVEAPEKSYLGLQWGRPFYGAERKSRGTICGYRFSFNGAALFTGRRVETLGQRKTQLFIQLLLQWGRPFYGAESYRVYPCRCF